MRTKIEIKELQIKSWKEDDGSIHEMLLIDLLLDIRELLLRAAHFDPNPIRMTEEELNSLLGTSKNNCHWCNSSPYGLCDKHPVSEKKEHLCRIGRIMRRTTVANCPLNCEDSVEEVGEGWGGFVLPDPGY